MANQSDNSNNKNKSGNQPEQSSNNARQFHTGGIESKNDPVQQNYELQKTKSILARVIRLNLQYFQLSDGDKNLFRKHYGVNDDPTLDDAKRKAAPSMADTVPEEYQGGEPSSDPKYDLSDTPSWSKPYTEKSGLDSVPKNKEPGDKEKDRLANEAKKQVAQGIKKAVSDVSKKIATWAAETLWPFLVEYGGIILLVIGVIALIFGLLVAAYYFVGNVGFGTKNPGGVTGQVDVFSYITGASPGANTIENAAAWHLPQISDKGCQITSIAMYYRFLGHKTVTEDEVRQNNPGKTDRADQYAILDNLEPKYHVIMGSDKEFHPANYSVTDPEFIKYKDFLRENVLINKTPVIIGVGSGGGITSSTHFMVVIGWSDTGITVNDPNINRGAQNSISWDTLAISPYTNFYFAYTLRNKQ